MQIKKIIPGVLIAAFVFLPFKQCFTGQQSYNFYREAELIRTADNNTLTAVNYGTFLNVNIESGTDWENITFEISVYVYGVTRFRNMNYPDSFHISKANIIRDYQAHIRNICRIPYEKITNFSNQFAGNKMSSFEKNPYPAASFPKSFNTGYMGKQNRSISLKYLFKTTGTITLHLRKINGENIFTVSRGKAMRQLCCLKVNNREILRKVNYYLI